MSAAAEGTRRMKFGKNQELQVFQYANKDFQVTFPDGKVVNLPESDFNNTYGPFLEEDVPVREESVLAYEKTKAELEQLDNQLLDKFGSKAEINRLRKTAGAPSGTQISQREALLKADLPEKKDPEEEVDIESEEDSDKAMGAGGSSGGGESGGGGEGSGGESKRKPRPTEGTPRPTQPIATPPGGSVPPRGTGTTPPASSVVPPSIPGVTPGTGTVTTPPASGTTTPHPHPGTTKP